MTILFNNASTLQLPAMEPMLAVHLENLLFLLLLVVAGLFQLLGRAARKGSADEEKPKSTPLPKARKPIPRAPVESDHDRLRLSSPAQIFRLDGWRRCSRLLHLYGN